MNRQANAPPRVRPRFDRIDSLRMFGAVAVAAFHFSGWYIHGVAILPPAIAKWIPAHASLMVFFVMSGFVLNVSLNYGHVAAGPASLRFLLGRAFRFYPIVFVSTFLAVLVPVCQVGGIPMCEASAGAILRNMLLLDVNHNHVLWALQVELLMAPVILLLHLAARRLGDGFLLGAAAVMTPLAFVPGWAFWPPLSANAFSFALGMAIPAVGPRIAASMRWPWLPVLLLAFTGPLLGIFSTFSAVIEGWAAFGLISWICYRRSEHPLLIIDSRRIQAIGAAAGSFYVLHMATCMPFVLAVEALCPSEMMQIPGAGAAALLLWLAMLIPIALFGFRFIEMPGIVLGKRVVARLPAAASMPNPMSLFSLQRWLRRPALRIAERHRSDR